MAHLYMYTYTYSTFHVLPSPDMPYIWPCMHIPCLTMPYMFRNVLFEATRCTNEFTPAFSYLHHLLPLLPLPAAALPPETVHAVQRGLLAEHPHSLHPGEGGTGSLEHTKWTTVLLPKRSPTMGARNLLLKSIRKITQALGSQVNMVHTIFE
jgi:hypothetical protein